MVRACKRRVRREMLMPVWSDWTLNPYNTWGCGSCGSCEVWCCMKRELRTDEGNGLSSKAVPTNAQSREWCLWPCSWHSAGRWWRRNKGLRPAFHSLINESPQPLWMISQLQHFGFVPHCHGWCGLELLQLLPALSDPCWASHECLRCSSSRVGTEA